MERSGKIDTSIQKTAFKDAEAEDCMVLFPSVNWTKVNLIQSELELLEICNMHFWNTYLYSAQRHHLLTWTTAVDCDSKTYLDKIAIIDGLKISKKMVYGVSDPLAHLLNTPHCDLCIMTVFT